MKSIYITIITFFLTFYASAQLNLTPPSDSNMYLWVVASNNDPNVNFHINPDNDNPNRSLVSFAELIPGWTCEGFSCTVPKEDIRTISLTEFNENYKDNALSFIDVKSKIGSINCGDVGRYMLKRAYKTTYFIIEGNQVKVYLKAFCGALNDYPGGIDYEEVTD